MQVRISRAATAIAIATIGPDRLSAWPAGFGAVRSAMEPGRAHRGPPIRARAKSGSPSVHPMQGDEIRALRRLQREQDHPRTYHDRARSADDAKGLSFQSPVTAPQDSEQTVIECVAAFAPHTAKPARRLAR